MQHCERADFHVHSRCFKSTNGRIQGAHKQITVLYYFCYYFFFVVLLLLCCLCVLFVRIRVVLCISCVSGFVVVIWRVILNATTTVNSQQLKVKEA